MKTLEEFSRRKRMQTDPLEAEIRKAVTAELMAHGMSEAAAEATTVTHVRNGNRQSVKIRYGNPPEGTARDKTIFEMFSERVDGNVKGHGTCVAAILNDSNISVTARSPEDLRGGLYAAFKSRNTDTPGTEHEQAR